MTWHWRRKRRRYNRYCESIVDHRPHNYDFGDGKFYHCDGVR